MERTEDMNLKVVKSAKLAKILINDGFVVRDIKPNKSNKTATVFLFESTPELLNMIDEFMEQEQEEKILRDWKAGKSF